MRITLLFLCISQLLFAQNAIIEFKIDSIAVSDSIDYERKYTIHYHLENKTDKTISFLLDTSNSDTLHGVKVNRMQCTIYQDKIEVKNFFFSKKYDYLSVLKTIEKLRNSKTIEEEEALKKDPELTKLKIHPVFLEKIIEKRDLDYKKLRAFENRTIYQTLKTLNPREKQHFQLILYWDKERYFKNEDSEFYLSPESNYTLELSFTTLDYDYLLFDSTEGFDYDASQFFNSTTVSNKMPFHFDE